MERAGHAVRVSNFDLDCPGSTLTFSMDGAPTFSQPPGGGQISCNAVWDDTVLQIPPENEFFGAFLMAHYDEGTGHRSNVATWRLEYDDLVTPLATVRIVE